AASVAPVADTLVDVAARGLTKPLLHPDVDRPRPLLGGDQELFEVGELLVLGVSLGGPRVLDGEADDDRVGERGEPDMEEGASLRATGERRLEPRLVGRVGRRGEQEGADAELD